MGRNILFHDQLTPEGRTPAGNYPAEGETIRFKLKDSRAFVGTRNRKGAQLTL